MEINEAHRHHRNFLLKEKRMTSNIVQFKKHQFFFFICLRPVAFIHSDKLLDHKQ